VAAVDGKRNAGLLDGFDVMFSEEVGDVRAFHFLDAVVVVVGGE